MKQQSFLSLMGAGVILALVVVGILGCEPSVSDDATIIITGRVLDEDGNPAEGEVVELWKSDLPTFDFDALLGVAIAAGTPFRTMTTDENGEFRFELNGADANTSGGTFAAYFAVTTVRGDDRIQAVASNEFQFSNQDLTENLPDLQYWGAGEAAVGADGVDFTWGASPTAPESGIYNVVVHDTWLDGTSETSYSLSNLALNPADNEHYFHVISLGEDVRYRTSFTAFSATNEAGGGIDYRQVDNNNISAVDCLGNNLFDLVDGDYMSQDGREDFGTSDVEGAQCLTITLPEATTVSDIVVHNGTIFFAAEASVEIAIRAHADDEFTVVDTYAGNTTDFSTRTTGTFRVSMPRSRR